MSPPLWGSGNSDGILGILCVVRIYLCCNSNGILAFPVAGSGFTFLGSAKLVTIHLSAFLTSKICCPYFTLTQL